MTSKNSFLVSMKENSKRRLWVWVISALGFMLLLPLYVALRISQIHQQAEWTISRYGAEMAEKIIHENLLNAVKNILGFSDILFILAVVLAVISAVQGFSWLYSRKKIDFYMGMPVKRSKRFLIIWLNGIFLYLIPQLLGLVIGMLIAAGNQGLNAGTVKVIFQALFVHLLLYLCVYHMAMLAVMLTGNIVITGMGFLVFCLYEWLARDADHAYKSRFFRYYVWRSTLKSLRFSPFTMYSEIVSAPSAMTGQVKLIVLMMVFAVLVGGLGYLAYLKRPAEGAGKAMVFEFTKPVIKILLVVPMALAVGELIASDVNYSPDWGLQGGGYVFFALALATILGCAVIQVLYEFDIKGALHQKRHILISGAVVAMIFCCYRYDLLHFDSYIPNADDVESIAFYPYQYDNADYRALWFEPENEDMSGRDYVDRYMYLTNAEDVCALVEYSMEKYNKDMAENDRRYNSDLAFVSNAYWSEARITYRLKGGREVTRRIWIDVNDEASAGYLDRIIGSGEFKEGYLMGASDRLSRIIEENDRYKISAYYGNAVYEQKLTQPELMELLECYQEDMELYNFKRIKESIPTGVIRIEFEKELSEEGYGRGTSTTEMGINIYPFFENSVACLKKFGFYMERQVVVEDIDRIYIKNYNMDASLELQELQRTEGAKTFVNDLPAATAESFGDNEIDTRRYADYTQKDDIEQIADCIYAEGMFSNRWDNGASYDPDYEVVVYFKAESSMNRTHGTTANYKFKKDEIPDFVKKDTTFQIADK